MLEVPHVPMWLQWLVQVMQNSGFMDMQSCWALYIQRWQCRIWWCICMQQCWAHYFQRRVRVQLGTPYPAKTFPATLRLGASTAQPEPGNAMPDSMVYEATPGIILCLPLRNSCDVIFILCAILSDDADLVRLSLKLSIPDTLCKAILPRAT